MSTVPLAAFRLEIIVETSGVGKMLRDDADFGIFARHRYLHNLSSRERCANRAAWANVEPSNAMQKDRTWMKRTMFIKCFRIIP